MCLLEGVLYLQLTGLVLGFTYSRTRCLATPILIHGFWNGGVLALLTALSTLGFDVEKMIAQ